MSRLIAYLDETGHSASSPLVGVAGFAAAGTAWNALDLGWREALAAEGVGLFHAREFAHSVGEFASWAGDERRRKRFLGALVRAILEVRPVPLGAFVDAAAARTLAPAARARMRDPYRHCLESVLRAALWLVPPSAGPLDLVVARSSEYTGEAHAAWGALTGADASCGRIGALRIGDARDVPALQAADLLAYELGKELGRRLAGGTTEPRWPVLALAPLLEPLSVPAFFDGSALEALYGEGT